MDQVPVPQSLYLFVATGVVFLLQAFPPVGVFLMILAAPVWSVVLVNAGFVGIVVEVLLGRVPPAWLALPALWFGGYALWRMPQRRALAAIQREVAAANARVRVPFDPAAQALVVEESTTGEGVGLTAAWLAEWYDVGVTYERKWGTALGFHAWRLTPAPVAERVRAAGVSGVQVRPVMPKAAGLCLLELPERPHRPFVEVRHRRDEETRGRLRLNLVTMTIRVTDGRSYEVRAGSAGPLPSWWPMPILGFALDSGTPAWRRIVGWGGGRRVPVPDVGPPGARFTRGDTVLAEVLGLRRLAPDERRAADPDATSAALDRVLSAR